MPADPTAPTVRTCDVVGCDAPHAVRGVCRRHYYMQRRFGQLELLPVLTLADRYEASVKRHPTGCWGWTGGVNNHGYGRVGKAYAHRVSWEIYFGPIPLGMHVLHTCDNPPCTNPEHLRLGTHQENMTDAKLKGRLKVPSYSGERHPSARLTWDDVHQIRSLRAQGVSRGEVARQFGLTANHVSWISNGHGWKEAA